MKTDEKKIKYTSIMVSKESHEKLTEIRFDIKSKSLLKAFDEVVDFYLLYKKLETK